MGYFSELDAEGPYRTCGEADEARRFYPEEYAMATAAPISRYRCIGCGDLLPAYRGSYCDACYEWDAPGETPGIDQVDDNAPVDPDPAPGRRTLIFATKWTADDVERDRLAWEWSRRLLAKKGAA